MSKPVPGYRYFSCIECGTEFKVPTRDHQTPSLEECPNEECGGGCFPYASEAHPEWKTDSSGNLVGRSLCASLL